MVHASTAAQDTSTPPPTPFFPTNPDRITAQDVASMIDSRLNIALAAQAEQQQRSTRKAVYTAVGVGVGGLVLGGTVVLVTQRIVRGRRARAASMK